MKQKGERVGAMISASKDTKIVEFAGLMRKYHISSNDYLNAVVDGLFQLFPELEETRTVKDYNSRAKKAKEEIEEKFPYLEELKEKKKEEAFGKEEQGTNDGNK